MEYPCMSAKLLQSCPTLCDPMDWSPPGSSGADSPGKNTGVGCHFLLHRVPMEMYIRTTFVQNTLVICPMSSTQANLLESIYISKFQESFRTLCRHIKMLTGVLLLRRKKLKSLKYQRAVPVCIMAYPVNIMQQLTLIFIIHGHGYIFNILTYNFNWKRRF